MCNRFGVSAVQIAYNHGNLPVLHMLLARQDTNINIVGDLEYGSLLHQTVYYDNIDIELLRSLLSRHDTDKNIKHGGKSILDVARENPYMTPEILAEIEEVLAS